MARTAFVSENEASNPALRSDMGFAQRVDMFAANQLHRLEKQIARRINEVADVERKLRFLEDEIAHFVEEYYAQVGDVCEAIDQYESALEAVLTIEKPHPPEARVAQKQQDASLRKNLYRRLVKQTHPDVNAADNEAFMHIQAAYESGEITALWRVEWQQLQQQWRACELTERMQHLTRWFRQLEAYAQELTARYLERKQSPEAVLLGRYMHARLSGKDWFGQMKSQLETHAQQTKHHMVCAKILQNCLSS